VTASQATALRRASSIARGPGLTVLLPDSTAPAVPHRADPWNDVAAQAVAHERDRIAADLHDGAGQILVAIGLLAHRQAEQLPAGSPERTAALRLAELADQGKWELAQVVQGVGFVSPRDGLEDGLAAVAEWVERDSGIAVTVQIDGAAGAAPAVQQALYRVAHQAIMNAWRHANCSRIDVRVVIGPVCTTLRVADDGRGGRPKVSAEGQGLGIAGMRRTVAGLGGEVRLTTPERGGWIVEAVVPTGGR
jgi:signal transduction histidine kinase